MSHNLVSLYEKCGSFMNYCDDIKVSISVITFFSFMLNAYHHHIIKINLASILYRTPIPSDNAVSLIIKFFDLNVVTAFYGNSISVFVIFVFEYCDTAVLCEFLHFFFSY